MNYPKVSGNSVLFLFIAEYMLTTTLPPPTTAPGKPLNKEQKLLVFTMYKVVIVLRRTWNI